VLTAVLDQVGSEPFSVLHIEALGRDLGDLAGHTRQLPGVGRAISYCCDAWKKLLKYQRGLLIYMKRCPRLCLESSPRGKNSFRRFSSVLMIIES
jgi:hypothetical protein